MVVNPEEPEQLLPLRFGVRGLDSFGLGRWLIQFSSGLSSTLFCPPPYRGKILSSIRLPLLQAAGGVLACDEMMRSWKMFIRKLILECMVPYGTATQLVTFLSAPFAHSLRTFFFTFPVLVFGNSSTISTSLGTINLLIPLVCFAHSITSSPFTSWPGCTVMKALGRSPQCESATATTPTSRIDGWVASIDSKATEEIFSPPFGHS